MAGDIALILLFVLAALALRGLSLSTRRRAGALAAMDHSTIEDLHAEATAVREQLGPGVLSRPCKILGIAEPEGQPLVGPISGQPVLWYDAKVIHHFWKDHYKTDKHGNQQHRRTRHQEVLSHEVSSSATVLISDGTGQVAVDLAAARLDGTRKIIDQMRPHASRNHGGPATIGYSHIEMALLPGESLFVTGSLRERQHGRGLEIVGDGKKGPLVSTRTEADVIAGRHRLATGQAAGAVVCALIAAVGSVSTVSEALEGDPAATTVAADRTSASRTAAASPSARPTVSPAAIVTEATDTGADIDFTMPDLAGADLQSAQDTVQTFGLFFSSSRDLAGIRNQVIDSNWRVCSQTPAAGTQVVGKAEDINIDFGVVRQEETCP